MSTLRDDALRDFLSGASPSAREDTPADEFLILEGVLRDGALSLPDAAGRHPSFDGIARAVRDSRGSNGAIMARHLLLTGTPDAEGRLRLMLVGDGLIARYLADLSSGKRILPSEVRLVKQLVCGFNLSEAASLDGVSHETKRSQYKSLAQKTGARSQSDLVGKVLMRLVLAAGAVQRPARLQEEPEVASLVHAFVPSARVRRLGADDGPPHHIVEVGPPGGAPFVMIHPQVLPDFTDADVDLLHAYDLRVVIPLRNGALAPDAAPLDVARHMDHACRGIDLAIDHAGLDRAGIMACISGGPYGIEYARRRPERVASLALVGACVRPNIGSSTAGRLRSGMLSLAMRNWALYSKAIEFYGRRIRRPETCRQLLLNVYRPCLADLAVIEAEYRPPHNGERLRRFFSGSVESIKHDFYHQAHPRWDHLGDLRVPAGFLHGASDFIHTLASVRELARVSGDLAVMPIEGAGQLLYHRHFRPLLDTYLAFVSASARASP